METIVTSHSIQVHISPSNPLVLIGERINPTGRTKLAAAMEAGDMALVKEEALKQVQAGAHILDVNVGVSGIDEPKLLVEAIQAVQAITDVPLCIDSADVRALNAGLSVYRGKALVNSVNGEERKLKEVLPLVKHYQAAVIGLTMDDAGIPQDPDRRLAIAGRIIETAGKEGIPPDDIIIDPLAMAASADDNAGVNTLDALRKIRDVFGVNQTLGLSNISFGLPERKEINAIFLAMAVMCGLTCPIMDPTVWEMRRSVLLTDLFRGKDEFCINYITAYRERAEQAA